MGGDVGDLKVEEKMYGNMEQINGFTREVQLSVLSGH